MRFIRTTLTAVEKLKRLAKAHRDETGTPLSSAQEVIARANGYDSWKHLKLCLAQTERAAGVKPDAPQSLQRTPLAGAVQRNPAPSPDSVTTAASTGETRAGLPVEEWLIPRLSIRKIEPGFYEFDVSEGAYELDSGAGFESISSAIEAAASITGPIRGFEVGYSGYTIGTFPLWHLRNNAEHVADLAVETVATMRSNL